MKDGWDQPSDPPRHVLKTLSGYYDLVKKEIKNFEVRQYSAQGCGVGTGGYNPTCPNCKPGRDFKVGDLLELRDKSNPHFYLLRKITYILKDTDECMQGALAPGWCVLGIARIPYSGPEYNDDPSRDRFDYNAEDYAELWTAKEI